MQATKIWCTYYLPNHFCVEINSCILISSATSHPSKVVNHLGDSVLHGLLKRPIRSLVLMDSILVRCNAPPYLSYFSEELLELSSCSENTTSLLLLPIFLLHLSSCLFDILREYWHLEKQSTPYAHISKMSKKNKEYIFLRGHNFHVNVC